MLHGHTALHPGGVELVWVPSIYVQLDTLPVKQSERVFVGGTYAAESSIKKASASVQQFRGFFDGTGPARAAAPGSTLGIRCRRPHLCFRLFMYSLVYGLNTLGARIVYSLGLFSYTSLLIFAELFRDPEVNAARMVFKRSYM